ncbi:MAG: hypothetical protein KBG73_08415 [Candidatus Promineofilum sp.]|nr:hypothetical protein [Promineifilum sp.]
MIRLTRIVLLLLLLAAVVAVAVLWRPRSAPVVAAPNVFSGPVNGGCYLQTMTTCAIHVDNWQPIVPDAGQTLAGFQLAAQASGAAGRTLLYDFRTDVSNPPTTGYTPSLVKRDFAARCDTTYHLLLSARDSGDLSFEEVGRTTEFTCPAAAILYNFLPVIRK